MIKTLATDYDVRELCEVFDVSSSGYYAWTERKPSRRQVSDHELSQHIRQAHVFSRKTYGSPRITKALRKQGMKCGKKRVARIMKQNGLRGAQKARFRPRTTDSRHDLPVSPNRLADLPTVDRINYYSA